MEWESGNIQYSLALEPVNQGKTPVNGYEGTDIRGEIRDHVPPERALRGPSSSAIGASAIAVRKSYVFMTPVDDLIRRSYDQFAIARKVKMLFHNSRCWL